MTFIPMPWELFPHQADIGIRGRSLCKAGAFEQAATALTAVVTDPGKVEPLSAVAIHCEEADDELLFTDWINALIYEMATRHMLFSRFEVVLTESSLVGQAWGESIDLVKHEPAVEVKGATYTSLQVRQESNGEWIAQCVVDV